MTLKFYLLPELDILTMDFETTLNNPFLNIDMLFGGLFDGKNSGIVQISENEFLTMNQGERCFKWVHTLAGVTFDNVQLGQYIKEEDEVMISGDDQIISKI